MHLHSNKAIAIILVALLIFDHGFLYANAGFNYKDALTKSLMFLEAQRSGKLPKNNRISWRGDSALDDGQIGHVDLVGGYYDAGDNVKYGLPMAFTITTLAWAALHFSKELKSTGEWQNILSAIRWGTDYFLKCSIRKNQLYVQVGDPVADHQCWIRPENMKTPRTLYKISKSMPGTEIAAETAAAMAASAMVFRTIDHPYSRRLLNKAKLLFDFAKNYKGTYDGECPFYCSFSGYNDELLWAASWLYIATRRVAYKKFISYEAMSSSVAEFSWDLKFSGAQVLLSNTNLTAQGGLLEFKSQADNFVCQILPDTPYRTIRITPGGMVHLRNGANTQYVTGTAFLFIIYGDILSKSHQTVTCGHQQIKPARLVQFAKQQMDYLLGNNPKGRSYMVGFGKDSPTQAHHRGASVPVLADGTDVNCGMSFVRWCNKDVPNVHQLTGAIVGGPDADDDFEDKRTSSSYTEPCTYINSLAVGPLARLAVLGSS
ncbi:uncharacterized protein A4U43_C06F4300 [Asparagus officinalis]|uniref:Endoglucanase n=1 Tax=Asparagus officinalis TaxID=4686 RepID=A0A5P1EJG6_ASPOF|nr:endoglucanase 8-like [Asparagus officinalis]ONK66115.1 uncharacterized protein A4U43_C06F4300 [Asparagus officinalis]